MLYAEKLQILERTDETKIKADFSMKSNELRAFLDGFQCAKKELCSSIDDYYDLYSAGEIETEMTTEEKEMLVEYVDSRKVQLNIQMKVEDISAYLKGYETARNVVHEAIDAIVNCKKNVA
jgi:hypothetical protein